MESLEAAGYTEATLPQVVPLKGDEVYFASFNVDADQAMELLGIKRSRLNQISGRELRVGRARVGAYQRALYRSEDIEAYLQWTRATASHKKSSELLSETGEQVSLKVAQELDAILHASTLQLQESLQQQKIYFAQLFEAQHAILAERFKQILALQMQSALEQQNEYLRRLNVSQQQQWQALWAEQPWQHEGQLLREQLAKLAESIEQQLKTDYNTRSAEFQLITEQLLALSGSVDEKSKSMQALRQQVLALQHCLQLIQETVWSKRPFKASRQKQKPWVKSLQADFNAYSHLKIAERKPWTCRLVQPGRVKLGRVKLERPSLTRKLFES